MTCLKRKRPAVTGPGAGYIEAFGQLASRRSNDSRPHPATQLLGCLDGVRETGAGRWMARCPVHDDRNPSLAVRELDDGRLLVHDFGGCDTGAVLGAVGLTLADLYPDKPESHGRPERRPWHAQDVLAALATEATVAAVAAGQLAEGDALDDEDRSRLMLAAGRLAEGARKARGVPR